VGFTTRLRFFRNAPTVIIVSAPQVDRFGSINAGAATENILLAAQSLGIASCWIGMVAILARSFKVVEYGRELMLPEGFAPVNGITLGYPGAEAPPAPERKPNLVTYIL